MKKQRNLHLCIAGYAGCGNLGDDAILQGILSGLFANGIRPWEVTVFSGAPRLDSRRFGVRCVGRKNLFLMALALLRADVFVLGGGTLLQNATGRLSLAYYLGLLRLARFCGCRTVCMGGLGPVFGAVARSRVRRALDRCALLLFRDGGSAAFARKLGVRNPTLMVGADPAFLLPLPPPLRSAFLHHRLTGSLQKRFFCVCPSGGSDLSGVFDFLSRRMPPFYPVYLLCDPSRDLSAAQALQRRFGGVIYRPRDSSEALAILRAAALTLSCRLHPLILSCRVGTRCVCFSSGDPKLSAFCRRAGIRLFSASSVGVCFPAVEALLAALPPASAIFCRSAAKDLAILSRMVYNRGVTSSPDSRRE